MLGLYYYVFDDEKSIKRGLKAIRLFGMPLLAVFATFCRFLSHRGSQNIKIMAIFTDIRPCGSSIFILYRSVILYDIFKIIFGAYKPSAILFELPKNLEIA